MPVGRLSLSSVTAERDCRSRTMGALSLVGNPVHNAYILDRGGTDDS